MKIKHYISVFFCFVVFLLQAQNLFNPNFNQFSLGPCTYDSTQLLLQADNWQVYQTLNDQWDGPVDETKCIGFILDGNQYRLNVSEVDSSKPLFVRNRFIAETELLLEKNTLFQQESSMVVGGDSFLNLSGDCHNGICSGTIAVIEVPNEDSTGTNLRLYPNSFVTGGSNYYNEACLVTERFEVNNLKEYIIKLDFDGLDISDSVIRFYYASLGEAGTAPFIDSTVIVSDNQYSVIDSSYHIDGYDLGSFWNDVLVVPYRDTTYPSAMNISYTDINLENNVPEPQNIVLTIDWFPTVTFQRYANLRGGLVADSDSTRHYFNLVNNGGNLCYFLIEGSFSTNESYTHKAGSIHFGDNRSCMEFKLGGKLIVADNTTFEYGQNGMGLLALRQGGTIELGQNSTLVINNTMLMYEYRAENIPQQIYMTLNAGSSLIFGEYAHLSNKNSVDGTMKLNVYMNGGVLDDRNLSPEERALINRIYPDETVEEKDDVFVFPNPASTYCNWVYHSPKDGNVFLKLYDASGRLIISETHPLQMGPNQIALDLSECSNNIYFLHWQVDGENGVRKVVVSD